MAEILFKALKKIFCDRYLFFSYKLAHDTEGYLLALREYGLEANQGFIFNKAFEKEDVIYNYITNIKNLPVRPTAWFCVNDGLGFLVNTCLQQQGIKVPEEASICSYDNGQLSQVATPKITTIDIDLDLYGRKAVEQLCWRMENRNDPFQEILLSSKLLKRDSTAHAPSKKQVKSKSAFQG